ncbi:MAG: hypothetical protein ACT4OU_02690 [Hyphomicrobium sp.]
MSDSELVAQFHDTTIEGSYPSGRSFSESYRSDGRVDYAETSVRMKGYWSITSGTLCTIYDTDPAGGCFRVARVGENCFEFHFASRTEQTIPGQSEGRADWTARAWIQGKPSACPPEGAEV